MPNTTRVLRTLTLFALAAGCSPPGPKLYPVSGQLLVGGKPAEGATVVLDGPAGAKPSGATGADGRFTLSTYPHGDGAPAGEYAVVVTWYPPNARAEGGKNRLPARYADAETTPLPKITVREGANALPPIDLPTK